MQERQQHAEASPSLDAVLSNSVDARMAALASEAGSNASDIPFLLSLLASSDTAVLESALDAVWKLSISAPIRSEVLTAYGVQSIIALLGHGEPRVVRVAAGTCSILALDAKLRAAIQAGGGTSALAAAFTNGTERVAEQAVKALAALAADEPVRASMVEYSVPAQLAVTLQRTQSPQALKEASCRALGVLASSSEAGARAATAFTSVGGATSLADCLHHAPADGAAGASLANPLVRAAVRAVSSLARHRAAAAELERAGALPSIVHLLGSGGQESAEAAAAALGAMASWQESCHT